MHGGEEKVEEVRVGLLGFRKEVDGLKAVVAHREGEMGELLDEWKDARAKIQLGRRLVDLDERLQELESELIIETSGKTPIILGDEVSDSDEDEDEEDEEDDQGNYGVSVAKLRRTAMQYMLIQELGKGFGEHPFVAAQSPRLVKVRSTLLMDLSTALQQAKRAGQSGSARLMKIMKIYTDMGESAEAVKVLGRKA